MEGIEEARENTPYFETVSSEEIKAHFGIENTEGQKCRIINNHSQVRERLMLNAGIRGRKRVIIDFDPDYFCFVHREIPIEPFPSRINP